MAHRASVVCVGSAILDTIALVDRLPGEDQRVEADQVVIAGGGNASTSAVAIARLGVDVEFSGIVGDDEAGATVLAQLEAEGVGTSLVERRAGVETSHSVVVVSRESGARAILTRPAVTPDRIPSGFDWVHVDKAGYRALAQGGRISSAVSLDDGNPVPGLDLNLIDLYVPTAIVLRERFPGQSAEDGAREALRLGTTTVVATDGAHGSFAATRDQLVHSPGLPITPLSTLGAGDVFHGALLAAIVLGKPLQEAIRFANVTAALSCRALDGRSGIPDRTEVEAALSDLP
ncbi:PfkB family carbohydrate kinase [Microbacterium sp. PRC9]|uniref:carbohydrate kinase family protein n=1 Tax=Microbacterium sp. PRC9 TaxID=2962591 RepID=UPI0028825221|nr:PfkB family carbohydrate kinase [Microbacterium sp. PRC9]MDT0143158.1 PfkB family carbohydrate kinase [Microbacterium sp. PRC9]